MNQREHVLLNNGSQGFRASLPAEIRVLSEANGEVEYIASDETIDSYREVIRADGWRFDLFKKNAPFVDTHDYSSISKQLGTVIDWRVDRRARRLIETVRWAKDVQGNAVAQLGWQMLLAGHGPKAVSVGFYPEEWVSRYDAQSAEKRPVWEQQLKELGLDDKSPVRCIYIRQQQIELSACIIGANPNAVQAAQKAYDAGVISRREFDFLRNGKTSPQFQVPFDTKRTITKDMKPKLARIAALFGEPGDSEPTTAPASRSASKPVLGFAGDGLTLRTQCELFLNEHPEQRSWLRAAVHVLCRAPRATWGQAEEKIQQQLQGRAIGTGDSGLGAALALNESLATQILFFALASGTFRTFGLVPMGTGVLKVASLTSRATAIWHKPASQGNTILETPSLTAASISPEASTVVARIEVSGEVLGDGKTTFEGAVMTALVEGVAYRLDWTCYQGDGVDNELSAGMNGIFADNTISTITAATGATAAALVDADDFANLIAAVDSSALQNAPRFWISTKFLPALLRVREAGDSSAPLLKPPTSRDDEWRIHGFGVTWATAAPGNDQPEAPLAAFGRGDAYTVGLRQSVEVTASGHQGWAQNMWQFRAIARARCQLRDAKSLAVLKLAAA